MNHSAIRRRSAAAALGTSGEPQLHIASPLTPVPDDRPELVQPGLHVTPRPASRRPVVIPVLTRSSGGYCCATNSSVIVRIPIALGMAQPRRLNGVVAQRNRHRPGLRTNVAHRRGQRRCHRVRLGSRRQVRGRMRKRSTALRACRSTGRSACRGVPPPIAPTIGHTDVFARQGSFPTAAPRTAGPPRHQHPGQGAAPRRHRARIDLMNALTTS